MPSSPDVTGVSADVLAAEFRAHMKSCDERAERDHADMERLAKSVDKLGEKVENGLQRVHQRIDKTENANNKIKVSALVFILALLLSIISYLLVNGVPWR